MSKSIYTLEPQFRRSCPNLFINRKVRPTSYSRISRNILNFSEPCSPRREGFFADPNSGIKEVSQVFKDDSHYNYDISDLERERMRDLEDLIYYQLISSKSYESDCDLFDCEIEPVPYADFTFSTTLPPFPPKNPERRPTVETKDVLTQVDKSFSSDDTFVNDVQISGDIYCPCPKTMGHKKKNCIRSH